MTAFPCVFPDSQKNPGCEKSPAPILAPGLLPGQGPSSCRWGQEYLAGDHRPVPSRSGRVSRTHTCSHPPEAPSSQAWDSLGSVFSSPVRRLSTWTVSPDSGMVWSKKVLRLLRLAMDPTKSSGYR